MKFTGENMKFTGMSNLFIYITAMFLYMELCYCISIERALRDRYEFFNESKCDDVENSDTHDGKCRCGEGEPILASHNHTKITCSGTPKGTNTYLP